MDVCFLQVRKNVKYISACFEMKTLDKKFICAFKGYTIWYNRIMIHLYSWKENILWQKVGHGEGQGRTDLYEECSINPRYMYCTCSGKPNCLVGLMYRVGSQYHLHLACHMKPYGEAVLNETAKTEVLWVLERVAWERCRHTKQAVFL